MFRRFAFLAGKDGITQAEFLKYWRYSHAPKSIQVPHFWRRTETYIQNHVLSIIPASRRELEWRGIVELIEYEGSERLHELRDDKDFQRLVVPDEFNFMNPQKTIRVFAEPTSVLDGPASGVKVLTLITRDPQCDAKDFEQKLKSAPFRQDTIPGFSKILRRYVQHWTIPGSLVPLGRHAGYDLIEETWFDDAETAKNAYSGSAYQDTAGKQASIAHRVPVLVDEIVIEKPQV